MSAITALPWARVHVNYVQLHTWKALAMPKQLLDALCHNTRYIIQLSCDFAHVPLWARVAVKLFGFLDEPICA